MLNLVPFAGYRWIMTNRHIKSRLIRPAEQFHLPESIAISIAAAAIGTNQDLFCLGIECVSHLSPPTTNAFHRKTSRVVRATHRHPPQVMFQIVDATRDRLGDIGIGKIMHINFYRFACRLPFLPRISVVSDQFLLFGIDRDDRPASTEKGLPSTLNVAKLGVTIGGLFPFFDFGVPLQTIMKSMQQLGDF